MDNTNTVGINIARARIARRMTQTDLAVNLHTSRQQINNWEHGYRVPGTRSMAAIAQVLGCTVDDLLKPTGDAIITEQAVLDCWHDKQTVNGVSRALGICPSTVCKILCTHDIYPSEQAEQANRLLRGGMDPAEIATRLKISPGTLYRYLPYKSGSYALKPKSTGAIKLAAWRDGKTQNPKPINDIITTAQAVVDCWEQEHNVGSVAHTLGISKNTVYRLLCASGIYPNAQAERINRLLHDGLDPEKISAMLKIRPGTLKALYLPYRSRSHAIADEEQDPE